MMHLGAHCSEQAALPTHGRIVAMKMEWAGVHGIVVKGYGVASGPSADYPYGALERQIPIFKARGLDLSAYYQGTLNVDIHPTAFELKRPEFTFREVRWTDLHPPEHFSFSRCSVMHAGKEYPGWIYFPHPETKLRNFHNPSLLEVIAHRILRIKLGEGLDIFVNPRRVLLAQADTPGAAEV
jgi:hypothetical protein